MPQTREHKRTSRNHHKLVTKGAATPLAGFPAHVSSIKITAVRGKGSMSITSNGDGQCEFRANHQQLIFLSACIDIARLYNDQSLRSHAESLKRNYRQPERSRWYRDPAVAAENNRRANEECKRLEKSIAAYEEALKAKANSLGL